ncbi:MAG: Holliday junction branch migration protein RuvA [Planctomycetota bacterium]
MRVRITGELVRVGADRVELATDGGDVVHEVMAPPAVCESLVGKTGTTLTLHTREVHESQGQGSSFVPRLLGFTTTDQRALFELLTTVKGLGPRKALRAMAAPAGLIARAIAGGDVVFLKTLPEIGKRTAEAIVLDLREKVGGIDAGIDEASARAAAPAASAGTDQAVAALVNLGEQEQVAKDLVRRAIEADVSLSDASPDAILAAALAVRS